MTVCLCAIWVNSTTKVAKKLFQPPVYGLFSLLAKQLIGFGKMSASEESPAGAERGGVRCFQDVVLASIDEVGLGLGIAPPQQENEALPPV